MVIHTLGIAIRWTQSNCGVPLRISDRLLASKETILFVGCALLRIGNACYCFCWFLEMCGFRTLISFWVSAVGSVLLSSKTILSPVWPCEPSASWPVSSIHSLHVKWAILLYSCFFFLLPCFSADWAMDDAAVIRDFAGCQSSTSSFWHTSIATEISASLAESFLLHLVTQGIP